MNEVGTTPPSVGALVRSLVTETGTLMRQELHLASTELGHKARRAAADVGTIYVGALLANAGLIMIALAIVVVLAAYVPIWISALVVGIVAMGTGGAVMQRGIKAIRDIDPMPERTVQTLQTYGRLDEGAISMSTPHENDAREVKDITADIERTRMEMTATIDAIEHRLSPAELADQAKVQLDHLEGRVKALLKEGLADTKQVLEGQIEAAKAVVHEQIEDAKGAVKEELHEAKELVTQGLSDARRAVKEDITTAIATTKKTIRDATIGRVETIATKAGDVMNDTKDTLVDTVRQNPIPAALVGIGIVWLFMNRSSASRRRSTGGIGSALGSAGSTVAGAAHHAATAVRGAVEQGFDAASHLVDGATATTARLAHDASDMTGRLVHGAADAAGQLATSAQGAITNVAYTARDQATRAERGIARTLESNPLALGAVAVAAGVAVGYALPRTQREDALVGGMRDQVLQSATELAHEAATSLHHLTDQAGDNARRALSAGAK